ncbi:SGNH/GDSL hydrolase family protein [Limnohabitans lacus]|jgi:lysophospholipase L1-like esterase|uniref:SGNH/GDSL hydrolase family protein n=1 Tax=Limnohabitans lacus TaxID=3045173 RepID=A0ABT6X5T2_9BURK|nr:SGNH/GDSL hydrolase family protein [Limnohabitans sp. HM2-2]MDI9233481.1 SGNH/GDSL hydrolase family protein [Limnohabitans sp. HM2-2]
MVAALNGISTKQWVRQFSATVEPIASAFEVVLISLGSNDGKLPDPMTYQYLARARKSVAHAKRVIWIAPGPQFPARAQVQAVAMMHGDVVYERPVEQLHADSVHFSKAGYQRIASLVFKQ